MPALRTFIDSGVLIAAVRGTEDVAARAFDVLDDPTHVFITSDFVRLEVLPKATFHRRDSEVRFYEAFFAAVTEIVPTSDRLVAAAASRSV